MSLSHRLSIAALAFAGTAGGCALLGYNFDDYVPEGMGGGSSASSNASSSASSNASSNASSSAGMGGMGGGAPGCDCSSPMCLDHACADPPPAGWQGPVALYFGDDQSFSCPAPYGLPLLAGGAQPVGPPVTCTQCACDGGSCGQLSVDLFSAAGCMSPIANKTQPSTPGCVTFPLPVAATSVLMQKVTANPLVMCQPSGGMPSPAVPPAFTKFAALCAASQDVGVGCMPGSCLPKPPSPLDSRFCIYQQTVAACPPGYTNAIEFGTFFDDTRGCSTCACGAPGPYCPVSVDFFGVDFCQGASAGMFPNDNACHNFLNAPSNIKSIHLVPGSPCMPSLSMPIGKVSIKDPVKVCCK